MNKAMANVASRLSAFIVTYSIAPSSAMVEFRDKWQTQGETISGDMFMKLSDGNQKAIWLAIFTA
jgi:pyruvate/2-oxoacid:ferredoxin oxidoreductase alpha subunit